MYLVKIKNDNIDTIINAVSTNNNAPRITGTIKKGINTIDSFTFNILPNNAGYNKINALKTLVEVVNTKTNKTEFKGRILLPKHSMSDSGLLTKTVVCESELGYLMDSTQRYGEYHNISVRDFLSKIIDNHNKQVSIDKQFTVGKVDVVDNNDSLYRFLGYEKTLDTIKDKLIDRLGGELRIRYENGVRYLDYLTQIGYTSPTEIRLSKNLKSIEEEKDPTNVISRLVVLGAKIKKTETNEDGTETEVDTEERLTIKSVNNGLDYIDDLEAIEQFGIIEDTVTYDDVNFPDILFNKGLSYLKSNNKIKKKYNINALDLNLIGLDIDDIDIYNYHQVINPVMGINDSLRVIEKTITIENPHDSSVNIGDKFEDIKTYQLSIKKTANTIKEVATKVNNTITKVNSIEQNVVVVGGEVGDINNAINATNGNVEEMANLIKILSDTVIQNTQGIEELESSSKIISNDLTTIKNSLKTIETNVGAIKASITEIKPKIDKIDTLDTKLDTIINLLQTETP